MNEISILEKIKVIFEITKSNAFYPIIILFLVFISFLFITTNKNNAKESKKTYSLLYLIAITIILVKYASSLSTMFDYMMNQLFVVFYFPNIAVYLGAIITTNIVMWISMFSTKTKTSIKVINSIVFSVLHYLFILVLSIITKENINVFAQKELYQNANIHALIEFSSNIFLLWISFLIIYKIIKTYLENKKETKILKEAVTVEHRGKNSSKEAEKNSFRLPNNVFKTTAPYIVKRETSRTKIVYELPKQTENTAVYDQMLTLDDYKLLVSLLKEEKTKELKKKISTVTKENKGISQEQKKEDKENRLSELMELYKSVN